MIAKNWIKSKQQPEGHAHTCDCAQCEDYHAAQMLKRALDHIAQLSRVNDELVRTHAEMIRAYRKAKGITRWA